MHSDSARWSAAASSVLSASPGSTAWHACRSARNISGATPSRLFAGAEATVLSCAVALAVDDSTAGEGARAGASAAAGVAFGTGTGAGAGVSVGAGAAARADLSADAGVGAASLLELAVFGWAAGFRRLNLKPPSTSERNALLCRRRRRRLRHQVASCGLWSGLLLEGRRSLHSCGGSAAFLLGPQDRNSGSHTLFEAGAKGRRKTT